MGYLTLIIILISVDIGRGLLSRDLVDCRCSRLMNHLGRTRMFPYLVTHDEISDAMKEYVRDLVDVKEKSYLIIAISSRSVLVNNCGWWLRSIYVASGLWGGTIYVRLKYFAGHTFFCICLFNTFILPGRASRSAELAALSKIENLAGHVT